MARMLWRAMPWSIAPAGYWRDADDARHGNQEDDRPIDGILRANPQRQKRGREDGQDRGHGHGDGQGQSRAGKVHAAQPLPVALGVQARGQWHEGADELVRELVGDLAQPAAERVGRDARQWAGRLAMTISSVRLCNCRADLK